MTRIGALCATMLVFMVGVLAAPGALAAAAAPAGAAGPVIVVGVPGLRWSDLDEHDTPHLWRLTREGSAGALSVRTTRANTCPADGWLTLSAGQRARFAHGECALAPAPHVSGAAASVTGWADIVRDNAATAYKARPGLLGDAVHRAGGCTTAVGAGAVLGAADAAGRVDAYAPSIAQVPAGGWTRCPLTVVEIDDVHRAHIRTGVDVDGAPIPPDQRDRAAAVAAADRQLGRLLEAAPRDATLLVAGLSDTGTVPHLHVALAKGADYGPGYLTSNATRQPGLVTLTDLTTTALRALGLNAPEGAIGSVWRAEPTDAAAAAKVHDLDDEDVAAQAIRRVQPAFFIVLFGGQLVLYGLATVALRRRWGGEGARRDRRRILAATRLIALVGAAAPVASFLTNLLPWWRSEHPLPALIAGVTLWIALVTGLALAGPWRRSLLGSGLVIAAVTVLVLGVDVLTGSRLQLNALMGYTALVAGRFYGFGNQAFALFAVAALLTAAWLAERPLRDGRRRTAVATVAAVGVVAVAVDGWPGWGSDFGGVIAMVPAFAVLGLLIAGRRVSALRITVFCAAGAALVLGIAFADSLREDPSHLGRFARDLADGQAWDVIARKAGAMLRSLGYWPFTVAAVGALCFLYFVLAQPLQWRAALLERAYHRGPSLRPALLSALTLAIAGMLVNDSGVVVPAIAFSLAVPLTLAVSVRALELDEAEGTAAPSPPPTPADRSAATG
ncbi:hypothetical protein [Thermomonospora catenispora]|uniref:hypothetical protein n=1 Tax=Thermomonospora catenispora TaxID=2493090 RepID=UPI0011200E9D|nr:hypothetical protein [Thermomonospora catenispora]TNY37804.1 hypothetical protein EIO00_06520 [Thermomonospora catenispora]